MKFNKKMESAKFLFVVFFLSSMGIQAQQRSYSLKECINYATTYNGDLKNAQTDVLISKKKITEQVGTYLPQITASSDFADNLKLPVQLVPAGLFGGTPGTYLPLTLGTKYSWTSGVQLSQSVYNPAFSTNLKSAKLNKTLSEQSQVLTKEQIMYNVSVAYYNSLVIQKQYNTLKTTLESSAQSLKILELKLNNGMAKKIDVDKVRVSYNNTKSHMQQMELSHTQSINTLKYRMGMPIDSTLTLADINMDLATNQDLASSSNNEGQFENRIDFQMKETNLHLQENAKKQSLAAFFPTFSLYGNFNYNAMQEDLKFFQSSSNWFSSSTIGIRLSVPIFDGLQKQSKVAVAKLNVEKGKENLLMAEQSIKLDIANYDTEFKNAIDNIKNEKENLDLAESVYKETQLQYKQGMSTSLELVQTESSLLEAQNNYFNKLLDLYIARINLEKSKGTLIKFINNQF